MAKVSPVDGQSTDGSDESWTIAARAGQPLRRFPTAGHSKRCRAVSCRALLARGGVVIHQVGDETRVNYTPDRGLIGKRQFFKDPATRSSACW